MKIDGVIFSGGNDPHLKKGIKKIFLEMQMKLDFSNIFKKKSLYCVFVGDFS